MSRSHLVTNTERSLMSASVNHQQTFCHADPNGRNTMRNLPIYLQSVQDCAVVVGSHSGSSWRQCCLLDMKTHRMQSVCKCKCSTLLSEQACRWASCQQFKTSKSSMPTHHSWRGSESMAHEPYRPNVSVYGIAWGRGRCCSHVTTECCGSISPAGTRVPHESFRFAVNGFDDQAVLTLPNWHNFHPSPSYSHETIEPCPLHERNRSHQPLLVYVKVWEANCSASSAKSCVTHIMLGNKTLPRSVKNTSWTSSIIGSRNCYSVSSLTWKQASRLCHTVMKMTSDSMIRHNRNNKLVWMLWSNSKQSCKKGMCPSTLSSRVWYRHQVSHRLPALRRQVLLLAQGFAPNATQSMMGTPLSAQSVGPVSRDAAYHEDREVRANQHLVNRHQYHRPQVFKGRPQTSPCQNHPAHQGKGTRRMTQWHLQPRDHDLHPDTLYVMTRPYRTLEPLNTKRSHGPHHPKRTAVPLELEMMRTMMSRNHPANSVHGLIYHSLADKNGGMPGCISNGKSTRSSDRNSNNVEKAEAEAPKERGQTDRCHPQNTIILKATLSRRDRGCIPLNSWTWNGQARMKMVKQWTDMNSTGQQSPVTSLLPRAGLRSTAPDTRLIRTNGMHGGNQFNEPWSANCAMMEKKWESVRMPPYWQHACANTYACNGTHSTLLSSSRREGSCWSHCANHQTRECMRASSGHHGAILRMWMSSLRDWHGDTQGHSDGMLTMASNQPPYLMQAPIHSPLKEGNKPHVGWCNHTLIDGTVPKACCQKINGYHLTRMIRINHSTNTSRRGTHKIRLSFQHTADGTPHCSSQALTGRKWHAAQDQLDLSECDNQQTTRMRSKGPDTKNMAHQWTPTWWKMTNMMQGNSSIPTMPSRWYKRNTKTWELTLSLGKHTLQSARRRKSSNSWEVTGKQPPLLLLVIYLRSTELLHSHSERTPHGKVGDRRIPKKRNKPQPLCHQLNIHRLRPIPMSGDNITNPRRDRTCKGSCTEIRRGPKLDQVILLRVRRDGSALTV